MSWFLLAAKPSPSLPTASSQALWALNSSTHSHLWVSAPVVFTRSHLCLASHPAWSIRSFTQNAPPRRSPKLPDFIPALHPQPVPVPSSWFSWLSIMINCLPARPDSEVTQSVWFSQILGLGLGHGAQKGTAIPSWVSLEKYCKGELHFCLGQLRCLLPGQIQPSSLP